MIIDCVGQLPERQHPTDAGADLFAAEDATIPPGENVLVSAGLNTAIPAGFVGEVCSRSGMAAKHRVFVLNAPGIVDAGYRGDVKVNLMNLGGKGYAVKRGDRIAQLLVKQVALPQFREVSTLGTTERGEGGHGSTG